MKMYQVWILHTMKEQHLEEAGRKEMSQSFLLKLLAMELGDSSHLERQEEENPGLALERQSQNLPNPPDPVLLAREPQLCPHHCLSMLGPRQTPPVHQQVQQRNKHRTLPWNSVSVRCAETQHHAEPAPGFEKLGRIPHLSTGQRL